MLVVASSRVLVLFSLLASIAQAFFTAPIPDFLRDLSIYDANGSKRALPGAESNRVSRRAGAGTKSIVEERVDEPEIHSAEQALFVVEFESEPSEKEDKDGKKGGKEGASVESENQSPLDPWSIVWYIGSFGGLVAFFLIVSCSEWCCRRGARSSNTPYVQRGSGASDRVAGGTGGTGGTGVTETPPPPYHLFAPPAYDSVNYGELLDETSGEKIDIFVISVPVPVPVPVPSTAHRPAPA